MRISPGTAPASPSLVVATAIAGSPTNAPGFGLGRWIVGLSGSSSGSASAALVSLVGRALGKPGPRGGVLGRLRGGLGPRVVVSAHSSCLILFDLI